MKYWTTGCALAAAQLLGACAADAELNEDPANWSPTEGERAEIAGQSNALMDNCNDDQLGKLQSANVGTYYALWGVNENYDADFERRTRYFLPGFDDQLVRNRIDKMWHLNQGGEAPTFVCAENTHPHCKDGIPAFIDPTIPGENIYFCDFAFNTGYFCDDPSQCISSLTGVMMHEMAHLAGAVSNPDPVPWSGVQAELGQYPPEWRPSMTPNIAEIYHYYILNRPI